MSVSKLGRSGAVTSECCLRCAGLQSIGDGDRLHAGEGDGTVILGSGAWDECIYAVRNVASVERPRPCEVGLCWLTKLVDKFMLGIVGTTSVRQSAAW